MDTLQEMIKSIQKQNEKMQSAFGGLSSLQNLAETIRKQNETRFNLTGLNGITDIAKTLSHQMKFHSTSTIFESSIQTQLAAQQIPKNNLALFGLTSSLSDIALSNQLISDKLSGFASSQLYLSNSLTAMASTIQQSHLNSFNSLDIALQGISKTYLKDIALTRNWDAISIAEEANETIGNATEELLNKTSRITPKDIDFLRTSIITELSRLLAKTKAQRAKQYIFELITLVGFLLTIYGTFQNTNEISNRDVLNETKIEIEKISSELRTKIDTELAKLNKTRIAIANVNLRFSTKKNSKIIGLVKCGQNVTVIEIRHKYLLISYIDIVTGEPKSGFVMKKYFELEK